MRPPIWLSALAGLIGAVATLALLVGLRHLGDSHAGPHARPGPPEPAQVVLDVVHTPPTPPPVARQVPASSTAPAPAPAPPVAPSGPQLAEFRAPALVSHLAGGWPEAAFGGEPEPWRPAEGAASPAAEPPPVAPEVIRDAGAVAVPPRAIRADAPEYPRSAEERQVEGWVELELVIDAAGSVESARVVRSSPAGVFDAAALRAAKRWQFAPARHDGQAVSVRARQRVEFSL